MRKSAHPNINDTDTEDDTDDGESAACPANAWMDEWKNYINTVEDVPDGMDLVRWWGVCILFHLRLCHGSARTPLGTHTNGEDSGLEESRKTICT
jgi:hypothetical protein